jgi:acetyltransferase-like isoleucine patch superfamily enzyme
MKPEKIRPDRRGVPMRILLAVREALVRAQIWCLRRLFKMDIGEDVRVSLRAKLDFTYARGVHIGDGSYVAFGAVIFTHDMSRLFRTNTYVGRNCFIGANAIIMPGVRVGDQCIVGAGAVVTRDVPSGSIVVGNPAKVIRSGIRTEKGGILSEAMAEAIALQQSGAETAAQREPVDQRVSDP